MENINLSINPTYYCNFRCSFCYLSDEQLGSTKKLSVEALYARLSEVATHRRISRVDLYGGELGLVKKHDFDSWVEGIQFFYKDPISVISNGSFIPEHFLKDHFDLSFSWDYLGREKYQKVYQNLNNLNKSFHILVLASEKLIKMTELELLEFIRLLNALPNLQTVEIKPFSSNQYHAQKVTHRDFEIFVQRWLQYSSDFVFEFINETKIQDSLKQKLSAWSDDHLYVTPEGHFAVLEFDQNYKEYFKPIRNWSEYQAWYEKEKSMVLQSPICSGCRYLGRCLSEHLQNVQSLQYSCNGFQGLLSWYENERLQSLSKSVQSASSAP